MPEEMKIAAAKVGGGSGMRKYLRCPYCGKPAPLVPDTEVYRRSYGKSIYLCRRCDAYVGCHDGTCVPLGRMANKELRTAKRQAHAVFDRIWKSGEMTRHEAYKWLSEALGLPIKNTHIGEFDVEDCHRVVLAAKELRAHV